MLTKITIINTSSIFVHFGVFNEKTNFKAKANSMSSDQIAQLCGADQSKWSLLYRIYTVPFLPVQTEYLKQTAHIHAGLSMHSLA